MVDLPVKPVFDNGLPIGEARTTGDVTKLLRRSGYSEAEARTATRCRLIETPRAFDVVPALELDALMARARQILASR